MKKFFLFAGMSVIALVATSASAADRYSYWNRDRHDVRNGADSDYGLYMGASAGSLIYQEEGLSSVSPTILQFRVGEQFSPFIAIEGRIGVGINGDESNGYRVNAEAVYGGYVKGIMPFSPMFSLYGLAGVGGVQLHRNYADSHSNDAGLSFGAGVEAQLGGGASLNAEWVRVTSGTNDQIYDYTADQLTFGVNWRF